MTPAEVLALLRALGFSVRAEGEQVRVSVVDAPWTPAIIAAARAHKPALLEILRTEPGGAAAVQTLPCAAPALPDELQRYAPIIAAAELDILPTGRFELRPATEHDGPAEVTSLRAWVKELGRHYHAGRRGQALRDLAEVAEALRRYGWEPAGGNAL